MTPSYKYSNPWSQGETSLTKCFSSLARTNRLAGTNFNRIESALIFFLPKLSHSILAGFGTKERQRKDKREAKREDKGKIATNVLIVEHSPPPLLS